MSVDDDWVLENLVVHIRGFLQDDCAIVEFGDVVGVLSVEIDRIDDGERSEDIEFSNSRNRGGDEGRLHREHTSPERRHRIRRATQKKWRESASRYRFE